MGSTPTNLSVRSFDKLKEWTNLLTNESTSYKDVRLVCKGGKVVKWNLLALTTWSWLFEELAASSIQNSLCLDCQAEAVVIMPDVEKDILEKVLMWSCRGKVDFPKKKQGEVEEVLNLLGVKGKYEVDQMVETDEVVAAKVARMTKENPVDSVLPRLPLPLPPSLSAVSCPECDFATTANRTGEFLNHIVVHCGPDLRRDFAKVIELSKSATGFACVLCCRDKFRYRCNGTKQFLRHIAMGHGKILAYLPRFQNVNGATKPAKIFKQAGDQSQERSEPKPAATDTSIVSVQPKRKPSLISCYHCHRIFKHFNVYQKHLCLEHYSSILKQGAVRKGTLCNLCDQMTDEASLVRHFGISHGALLDVVPEMLEQQLRRLAPEESNVAQMR